MNSFDLTSSFSGAWNFMLQRFLLFYQWTDQITIGGVSLLKISIGLTALLIVFAVVLPVIRTAPVNAGLGTSGSSSARNYRGSDDA